MPQSFNAERKPRADDGPSRADKARALLSILEPGKGAPSDVPPDRLRDWANELIRTVEGEKAAAAAAPAPAAPVKPVRRALFTKAPPTLSRPPERTPPAAPAPRRAAAAPAPAPVRAAATPATSAPASRASLSAPLPHETEERPADTASITPPLFAAADVARIVEATLDTAMLGREHPAIVAMTLLGKPTIEQAAALRTLPGGQVRAVHRALRQMEAARAPSRETAVSE